MAACICIMQEILSKSYDLIYASNLSFRMLCVLAHSLILDEFSHHVAPQLVNIYHIVVCMGLLLLIDIATVLGHKPTNIIINHWAIGHVDELKVWRIDWKVWHEVHYLTPAPCPCHLCAQPTCKQVHLPYWQFFWKCRQFFVFYCSMSFINQDDEEFLKVGNPPKIYSIDFLILFCGFSLCALYVSDTEPASPSQE